MSGPITITLVNVNGMLVGRTFSDRWNLETLGATSLPYTRNQAEIKRLRRAHNPIGHVAFIFRFASKGLDGLRVVSMSPDETMAMLVCEHFGSTDHIGYDSDKNAHHYLCTDCGARWTESGKQSPYDDNPWYGAFAESHDAIPGLSPSDLQGTYL